MRVLLAMVFFTPIVIFAALKSGAEAVTPYLAAMGIVAICAQVLIERRARRG